MVLVDYTNGNIELTSQRGGGGGVMNFGHKGGGGFGRGGGGGVMNFSHNP